MSAIWETPKSNGKIIQTREESHNVTGVRPGHMLQAPATSNQHA